QHGYSGKNIIDFQKYFCRRLRPLGIVRLLLPALTCGPTIFCAFGTWFSLPLRSSDLQIDFCSRSQHSSCQPAKPLWPTEKISRAELCIEPDGLLDAAFLTRRS